LLPGAERIAGPPGDPLGSFVHAEAVRTDRGNRRTARTVPRADVRCIDHDGTLLAPVLGDALPGPDPAATPDRSHPMRTLLNVAARLAALALCAACTGCALTSAPRLSPQTTELSVPEVSQTRSDACGVATMHALAGYWNLDLPLAERALLEERAAGQQGLSGTDLRGSLEDAGMEVFVFRGTQDHSPTGLWHHLKAGRPLIVAIASGKDRHHFALLVGHDPATGAVVLRDPLQGRLVLPADRFTACWELADRFTLLAVAPGAAAPDLEGTEVAALTDAQLHSPELADLKAGHEFSDRDIKLIVGTAVVVIIIALLL
jgi:predicted double-glycine peptidase